MKLDKEEQQLYDSMSELDKLEFEFSYYRNLVPDNKYTDKQIEQLESILDKIAKHDKKIASMLGEGLYSSALA